MEDQNIDNGEMNLESKNSEDLDNKNNNGIEENSTDNIDNKPIEEKNSNKKKNSVGREIFEWFMVIVAALLISMVIKAFIFSTYKVNMVSMENTLFEGHNVIVYKTGYFFNQPKHGQIIVFTHEEGQFKGLLKYLPVANPGEVDYIKRVIGVPGDQIDIREGYVYRKSPGDKDFVKLDEPYVKGLTDSHGMQLPFTVPKDKLFVMGDNREQSLDSRQIGPIDIDAVIGHAVIRIWPFSKFGGLK
ncbi:MAG TPA: signal peptidase I [Ruminiclostridium sp.]|nr:signal peptidase I [Ruminiclostridium sp.]